MNTDSASQLIKAKAIELGFDDCGITPAAPLTEHTTVLEKWLEMQHHADMKFIEQSKELRYDVRKLFPEATSVIVVLKNYYNPEFKSGDYRVSQYAAGKDYHQVIRGKLRQLLCFIQEAIFSCNGRAFTDSAPLLERAWAVQAGLGWIGKNSMLISRRLGSYVFVGELVIDQTLEYDKPSGESFCGDCNRCIKACPTSAINNNSTIDARRCISYLTVEHHGSLPEGVRNKYSRWIFGCDICQEVCPWNRFAIPHSESEFSPLPNAPKSKHEWNSITKEEFESVFRQNSLKRAGFEAIKRNIAFLE